MTTISPGDSVEVACASLSSPPLIRLITEIDDNGAIPPRGLSPTFPDLAAHQLRQAVAQAHALGLCHRHPRDGMDLTRAGRDLADAYDALARWARRHAYPAPLASHIARIAATLALVATPLDGGPQTDLTEPRNVMTQWLDTHPDPDSLDEDEDEE